MHNFSTNVNHYYLASFLDSTSPYYSVSWSLLFLLPMQPTCIETLFPKTTILYMIKSCAMRQGCRQLLISGGLASKIELVADNESQIFIYLDIDFCTCNTWKLFFYNKNIQCPFAVTACTHSNMSVKFGGAWSVYNSHIHTQALPDKVKVLKLSYSILTS